MWFCDIDIWSNGPTVERTCPKNFHKKEILTLQRTAFTEMRDMSHESTMNGNLLENQDSNQSFDSFYQITMGANEEQG